MEVVINGVRYAPVADDAAAKSVEALDTAAIRLIKATIEQQFTLGLGYPSMRPDVAGQRTASWMRSGPKYFRRQRGTGSRITARSACFTRTATRATGPLSRARFGVHRTGDHLYPLMIPRSS